MDMKSTSNIHANDDQYHNEFDVPLEVFRNNTTAVEVVVKQVTNQNQYTKRDNIGYAEEMARLYKDIENLKTNVNSANRNLDEIRKIFSTVLCKIQKQLEFANQNESKSQTKNLFLQLEKEKLTMLLESKTNLVRKLKRELFSVRRLCKTIVKGLHMSEISEVTTDVGDEYTEFVKELHRSNSAHNMLDNNAPTPAFTLDSILSDKT